MVYEPPRGPITYRRAKREVNAEISSRTASDGMFAGDEKSLAFYCIVAIVIGLIVAAAWFLV